MNKKIIIDLSGVVFEPIDDTFTQTAIAEYGKIKGRILSIAYKYGIGKRSLGAQIENVFYKCASRPQVREGALEALQQITEMPDVSVEFCAKIASPKYAARLEQQYRAIAPCMNAATHYALISPNESKRDYIVKSTAADQEAMNYVLASNARHLGWPARWRISPVLVSTSKSELAAASRTAATARIFRNLGMFHEFLVHKK